MVDVDGVAVEKTGFDLREILGVATLARGKANVVDTAAFTADDIVKAPVNNRFLIEVVGVVCTQFNGLVSGLIQHWKLGIVEFDIPLQSSSGHP